MWHGSEGVAKTTYNLGSWAGSHDDRLVSLSFSQNFEMKDVRGWSPSCGVNHTSSSEFGEPEGYQKGTTATVGSDAAVS